jgi:hypothetical protein
LEMWCYNDFDTARGLVAYLSLPLGPAVDRILQRYYPGPQSARGALRFQVAQRLAAVLHDTHVAQSDRASQWRLEVEASTCILNVRITNT